LDSDLFGSGYAGLGLIYKQTRLSQVENSMSAQAMSYLIGRSIFSRTNKANIEEFERTSLEYANQLNTAEYKLLRVEIGF
jgi:hypothetical protein